MALIYSTHLRTASILLIDKAWTFFVEAHTDTDVRLERQCYVSDTSLLSSLPKNGSRGFLGRHCHRGFSCEADFIRCRASRPRPQRSPARPRRGA